MTLEASDARPSRRDLPEVEVPFRLLRPWECWAWGVLAGAVVFGATWLVQWLIYVYLLGHNDFHVVGVSVASLLTFIFVQRMMAGSRQRRLATLRRFQTIAKMNHHIRNSLQTILYQSYNMDPEEAARLKDAVDRIQWVLDQVLPAVHDDGKGKPPDDSSERAA